MRALPAREFLQSETCATCKCSLHYVDRDGPYAEWRYDKRTDLHRVELAHANQD